MSAAEESRVPPHSDDAERSLLGAILLDGAVLARVLPLATTAHFYSTSHQRIYAACLHLLHEGKLVDPVLIKAELERRGDLEGIGGEAYLALLAARVPSSAGAEEYARIVRERSLQRQVLSLAAEMQELARKPGRLDEVAACEARIRTLLASAPGSAARLVFRTADALEEDSAPAAWRCRGLLAEGYVTIFVGKPKDGKSTLAFAMLAAIEGGVAFLGLETTQTIAVYVCEESPKTIRQKAARFGLRSARFVTRAAAYPRRPFRDLVREAIAEAKRVGARILVIDTLTMWAGLAPDAEKDAGAMQVAIDVALEAAGEGLAVLVVHHARKAAGQDIDTVRGSGAIAAGADIIVTLSRQSGQDRNERALRVVGRDEECPPELVIRLDGGRYDVVGTGEEVKAANLREAILGVLPTEPAEGLKLTEIRAATKARREFVLKVLGDLAREGWVTSTGTGKRTSPLRYRKPAPRFGSGSRPYSGGTGTETREGAQNPGGGPDSGPPDSVPGPSSGAEPGTETESDAGGHGDSVPGHTGSRGTGTESEEWSAPEGDQGPARVSVPVPTIGKGTGTETWLRHPDPLPWLGHASDLAAIWDDLWSRWQERAATLEVDAGLPREEAERRAWEELAAC